MILDEWKTQALMKCVDIYNSYDENEVLRFTDPTVQMAWRVGRDFLIDKIKEDRIKNKDFIL